jgi:gas vesicle protein
MNGARDSSSPWIGITDTMEAVGPGGPTEPTPEQIEEDIRRTRDRISREVEAIGERLSPHYIKERAQEAVMEKVKDVANDASERARQAGSSAVQFVRDHPVSSALISVGIAWMLLENSSRRSRAGRGGIAGTMADRAEAAGSQVAEAVSGAIGRVTEHAGDLASTVQQKKEEISQEAKQKASALADRAREQVSAVAEQTRVRAREAGESARSTFERNPLAVGAVALAAGAMIGFLLPRTDHEDRIMGTSRDKVVDRALEKGTAAKQVAVKTAQRAGQVVREEADAHADALRADLRSAVDTMRTSAERVVNDAKETARQEAERQNLVR